ncbi:MAG: hypothetical protein ACXIVQ_04870 [Acidimicrobiales bacterium]
MSVLSAGDPRLRGGPLAAAAPAESVPRRSPAPGRPVERPPLRLVEPTPRRRPVRVGLVGTVAVALLIGGIFVLAAMHTLVVQAQYELDQVQQDVELRRGELDALRDEVARLESPPAVVAAALDLGLVNPDERVFLDPVRTEVTSPDAVPSDPSDRAASGADDAAAGTTSRP